MWFSPTKILFLILFLAPVNHLCVSTMYHASRCLKLDNAFPVLCKWEVCCSCLSQHLAVRLPIYLNVNFFSFQWLAKCLLGQPINLSKCPKHHGAFGKLNFQLKFSFVKCSCIRSFLIICFNHFANCLKWLGVIWINSPRFPSA